MSYVEKNLGNGEKIEYSAKIHWAPLLPHVILMFILIGFITIIPAIIRMFTTELVITNKKLVGKTGLINTNAMDSPLNKVQNIKSSSGILGKIFGYGDLSITTASGSYVFKCIAKPDTFKNKLNQEIENCDDARINKQAEKLASSINIATASR